jgi:glycosyltransferase involved in cell wall biosynthesis
LIRNKGEHEVFIVLNGAFSSTIDSIRAEFADILPRDNIRVWYAPGPVEHNNPDNNWRRRSGELIREAFIAALAPDFIVVTSLFEGAGDNALTSVHALADKTPTAVVLYDLIPHIYSDIYLKNKLMARWYYSKIGHLRRADLLLAISQSSSNEAVEYFSVPRAKSINISTAADPHFAKKKISDSAVKSIREKYQISRPFVMYTGGIDVRKNIEGLIRAFAIMPRNIREKYQLLIVCAVELGAKKSLQKFAKAYGLSSQNVVFTGFIHESDLVTLYNICDVFIFPSWHEGFGLPALEAMCCGAPVIGSNRSSLPEVIGREDALFDPHDDQAIADKIEQVLSDDAFREDLARSGIARAMGFSWDITAKRALSAMASFHTDRKRVHETAPMTRRRPKLAFVSPLPPQNSGISDYSAELLPELARHYDIDVVSSAETISDVWIEANCSIMSLSWFEDHSHVYDRVLYHMGNSDFHCHMFSLLMKIPGVVVLHDFFLSGVIGYMDALDIDPGGWTRELHYAHGYRAAHDRFHGPDHYAELTYPCNRSVIENSLGIIVHSEESFRLSRKWLGEKFLKDWTLIPLIRAPAIKNDRERARRDLCIDEKSFVVCSFGSMHNSKLNHRLLDAWYSSALRNEKDCHLVFVGPHADEAYREQLDSLMARERRSVISVSGRVDISQYRRYLAAADVGVQLRAQSRGETSAAVMDCLNYGLATILNAHGSLADVPADVAWKLPDEFDDLELVAALEALRSDDVRRRALGRAAQKLIWSKHSPRACGDAYFDAIERYYVKAQSSAFGLIKAIADLEHPPSDPHAWTELAASITQVRPLRTEKQLLVDISAIAKGDSVRIDPLNGIGGVSELLMTPPEGFRVEPVCCEPGKDHYHYARRFAMRLLNVPDLGLIDEPVESAPSDIYMGLGPPGAFAPPAADFLAKFTQTGGLAYFFISEMPTVFAVEPLPDSVWAPSWVTWFKVLAQCDGLICATPALADRVDRWLEVLGADRVGPVQLTWLDQAPEGLEEGAEPGGRGATPHSRLSGLLGELIAIIFEKRWARQLNPNQALRFWTDDPRLESPVGKRGNRWFESDGRPGLLSRGPNIPLANGRYRVSVMGSVGENGAPGAIMEVAMQSGTLVLGRTAPESPYAVDRVFVLDINVERPCIDLEVRIAITERDELKVLMIAIAPLEAPE